MKPRNDIVHGFWWFAPDDPDVLVLSKESGELKYIAAMFDENADAAHVGNLIHGHFSNMLVYRKNDFIAIETNLKALHDEIVSLRKKVLRQNRSIAPKRS